MRQGLTKLIIIMMCVLYNILLFQWDDDYADLRNADQYLIGFFVAFAAFYILEVQHVCILTCACSYYCLSQVIKIIIVYFIVSTEAGSIWNELLSELEECI